MKIQVSLILFLIPICFALSAQDNSTSYSSVEKWYRDNSEGGEIRVHLKIVKRQNDSMDIIFTKTMTPFSQVIHARTNATYSDGHYRFEFIDNWGNKASGNFKINGDEIELLIDCDEFSDSGKNLARLYGSSHTLKLVKSDDSKQLLE